jgi:glycosyltransferase involved in cell wall biosynthesis
MFFGEMKHKEVLDAISACQVFVMTSKREGLPTALLEAMTLQKSVVVPEHSGCKEVVNNEQLGFLYKPNSLEALLEQTKRALLYPNKGEKARCRILQTYDWKIVAKQLDRLYDSTFYG